MAEIIPQGEIYLLKSVPLSPDYHNTYWFQTRTVQTNYFQGAFTKLSFTKQYYQRKNRGWLRVQTQYINITDVSYMMWRNQPATALNQATVVRPGYENKWWYAFVDKIDYVNDNVVEIHYTLDVIQSYMFDVTYEDTYIERMTQEADVAGDNLIDEEIPIGDYAYAQSAELTFHKDGTAYTNRALSYGMRPIVAATCNMDYKDSTDGAQITSQETGNGMVNGCLMLDPYYDIEMGQQPSQTAMKKWLDEMPGEKYGAVLGIVMMPQVFREAVSDGNTGLATGTVGKLVSASITVPTTLGSYTPKNKKLLTYPYNALMINSSDGTSQVFAYEMFINLPIRFKLDYVYTYPVQGVLYPLNGYKMQTNSYYRMPYCMPLPQLPTCTWSNDTYKAWAAMNTGYTALSIAGSILDMGTVIGGALLGGMMGGTEVLAAGAGRMPVSGTGLIPYGTEGAADVPITISGSTGGIGGMSDIAKQVGGMRLVGDLVNIGRNLINVHNAKIQPDSFNGSASNLASVVSGMYGFNWCQRCVREDYAKQIDDYFTMFGYRQNRIMTIHHNITPSDSNPNTSLHNRTRFTYIKTSNMDVKGAIPADDKELYCSIFNNGIRFWSDTTGIGSYVATNSFIS